MTLAVLAVSACNSQPGEHGDDEEEHTAKTQEGLGNTGWGLLANAGFDQAPIKGTYFFAGNWANGGQSYEYAYSTAPDSPYKPNTWGYSVYPTDSRHLGWSESTANRAFTISKMVAANVNVVVMSYWGSRGTDYWARYAPMQTSTLAHDELFTAALNNNILIVPAIESYPGFILGDKLADYVNAAGQPVTVSKPAAGDNSLLGQIEDLVNRYIYCPAHPLTYGCANTATNPGWPAKWARLYDRTNTTSRYAINLLFTCSNRPFSDAALAAALDGLATNVQTHTGISIGFTIDPQDHANDFCNGVYLPKADSAGAALLQSTSLLGIHPFRDETNPADGANWNDDAVRIVRKRTFINGWVQTGLPVILDVTPGYDATAFFGPKADPHYGNSDNWRNYQSQLKGSGVRGITMNAWNGFTEGWASMENCGGTWGPACPSSGPTMFNWLQDTFAGDPRDCSTWQYVNGVRTHKVDGAICSKWYSLSGSLGFLGDARSSGLAASCTTGGRRTDFQNGYIFSSASPVYAHEVHGVIATTYASGNFDCQSVGGQPIGLPISDEEDSSTYCASGRRNRFQHGTIDWCPGWSSGLVHPDQPGEKLWWHNGASGATEMWQMNSVTRSSFSDVDTSLNTPDSTGWQPLGMNDFDRDGRTDIVWHNGASGATQVWYMNGVARISVRNFDAALNTADSTGWRIVGTNDFNQDGDPDVLWHHGGSGATQAWYMDGDLGGTTRTAFAQLDASLNVADSSGWRIVGTSDFNHDGKPDILWHNGASGATQVWFMAAVTRIGFADFATSLNTADSTGWRIVGTNDFNEDGNPDVFWHNGATGASQVWYMNGTARSGFADFAPGLNVADSSGWRVINR